MDVRHGDIRSFLKACAADQIGSAATVATNLARIAALDREGVALAAMLRVLPDVLNVAHDRDRARRERAATGPLHGVPIVVKDNIDLLGTPTTSGCRALADAMPWRTAPALATLVDAGAVVVGKTNLSEFSFEIRSRSSLGGDTRNPFGPTVTSGGSSGGTAVAVAAGYALAGLGTDTGGSIRVPAAYNGLVGLRPSWGAIATKGVAPLAPSTDTVGTLTRSVGDAAMLFGLLAARVAPEVRTVAGMRVGVLRQLLAPTPDGIDRALAALRVAGVTVEDAPALPADLIPGGDHIVDEEFGPAFDRYLRSGFHAGTAPASLPELIAGGRYLPDYDGVLRARAEPRVPAVRAAILQRHAALRVALEAIVADGGYDALLYPPSAVLPQSMDNPKGGWAPELAACSGWPALALPVGRTDLGMPLSVELLAPADAEPVLFALGAAIEDGAGIRPVPDL